MTAADHEIRSAFRQLLRESVRAVRYAKPARYVIRNHIRDAFRKDTRQDFDPAAIARTLELLRTATKIRGLEYALVRNIVRVWGEKAILDYDPMPRAGIYALRRGVYKTFDDMVRRLNESMGMCIK